MRRWLLLVGVLLAVAGIAVMALPFGRPEPRAAAVGEYFSTASHCSAPVISAWHRDASAGWYGYAPLTNTRFDAPFPSCQHAARRRLAGGLLLLFGGIAVGVVAWRRKEPGPTQPATDAA